MKSSSLLKSCLVGALALVAVAAKAQLIDYSRGFSNPVNIVANKNYDFGPIATGGLLRLTDGGLSQAASAFHHRPVRFSTFMTEFTFQMRSAGGDMADGIAFVIQNDSVNALGPSGGGLGYGPDWDAPDGGIPYSIAIKYDLYNNSGEGRNSTGIYFNGQGPTTPSIDLNGSGIDLHSQNLFRARISYDGFTLESQIFDTVTGAQHTGYYSLDLMSIIGSDRAWVGFTAGTGGLTAIQEVHTWRFQSVPEPGTLVAIAAAGLVALIRRKKRS